MLDAARTLDYNASALKKWADYLKTQSVFCHERNDCIMRQNNYNNYNGYQDDFYVNDYQQAKREYFSRTYGMMALGLGVTFLTAMATAVFAPWMAYNTMLTILLCIAELVLVVVFSRSIMTASYSTVRAMFLGYACLTGVTLSSVFMTFDVSTIFLSFLSTAIGFGSMALFGMRTERDLSGWGGALMGGLVGILVMSLVGIFLHIPQLDLFVCVFGVLVFMGLTAYDNQKLSIMFDRAGGSEMADRYAVYAALSLYLDFINLFIRMLELMSRYSNSRRR